MIAPLADVLSFLLALHAGMTQGTAQITGFAVGLVLAYVLQARPRLPPAAGAAAWRVHGRLLAVSVFAVFFRGGVLAWLTNACGIAPQVAIVPAVIVSTLLIRAGYAFSLAAPGWSIGTGARWQQTVLCALACTFALRLIYLGQMQLIPEEAYYWNYSLHPAMGYLDHPPMVAWLIRAGTWAFGHDEFGVRIGALGSALVAGFFTYRLTRNLFGGAAALIALLLMQILPYFFLCGMLMTPDAPLIAAWSACLFFLERALLGGRSGAWWGVGVSLGVGLLSKYTIGLLVPAMLVFALLDRESRRWLLRPGPYLAVMLALAIFSPDLAWNAQHEWASFAFQTSRRLAEQPQFALHKLLLGALLLLTPTGVLTLALASRNGPATATPDPAGMQRRRFLQAAVLVPLAVFVVFSLHHDVKLDWTGALWIAAVPALSSSIVCCAEQRLAGLRRRLPAAWSTTVVVLLLIFAGCLHYLVLGLPGLRYSRHVETEPVIWREFGRQIQQILAQIQARSGVTPLIVGMDRYVIASELAFYAPHPRDAVRNTTSRNLFAEEGLMYRLWFRPAQQEGRTLLLIGWSPQEIDDAHVHEQVAALGAVSEGTLSRYGTFVCHYYYRIATGYRAPTPP
ncbi:MAG TPA: glycosyltransferase family 39 protein [Steroidobacteraceae bacterium]